MGCFAAGMLFQIQFSSTTVKIFILGDRLSNHVLFQTSKGKMGLNSECN